MINKLKKKLTVLATVSIVLLMMVLVLIMNLVNYASVVRECDNILDVLKRQEIQFWNEEKPPAKPKGGMRDFLPRGMSPEVPYEARSFFVKINADGTPVEVNLSRIISVDKDSIENYISKAMSSRRDRGFIDKFRFDKTENKGITTLLFLDCGRKLEAFYSFLWISIAVGVLGCLIVFLFFMCMAGNIVRPIAESYEKQKRFISNAGHEIKTPLTIINANVDLLENEDEQEEIRDIKYQVKKLSDLTNKLITLSKMEETDNMIPKVSMPLSDVVREVADTFKAYAATKNIEYMIQTEPDITIAAYPDSMEQLVSIILENAFKYVDAGGYVKIILEKKRKNVALSVVNSTADKLNEEDMKHVFERFYRTGDAGNIHAEGHGLGLSIAETIVRTHNGTITASANDLYEFQLSISLPQ